jgi:hypothetical protein
LHYKRISISTLALACSCHTVHPNHQPTLKQQTIFGQGQSDRGCWVGRCRGGAGGVSGAGACRRRGQYGLWAPRTRCRLNQLHLTSTRPTIDECLASLSAPGGVGVLELSGKCKDGLCALVAVFLPLSSATLTKIDMRCAGGGSVGCSVEAIGKIQRWGGRPLPVLTIRNALWMCLFGEALHCKGFRARHDSLRIVPLLAAASQSTRSPLAPPQFGLVCCNYLAGIGFDETSLQLPQQKFAWGCIVSVAAEAGNRCVRAARADTGHILICGRCF